MLFRQGLLQIEDPPWLAHVSPPPFCVCNPTPLLARVQQHSCQLLHHNLLSLCSEKIVEPGSGLLVCPVSGAVSDRMMTCAEEEAVEGQLDGDTAGNGHVDDDYSGEKGEPETLHETVVEAQRLGVEGWAAHMLLLTVCVIQLNRCHGHRVRNVTSSGVLSMYLME